MQDLELNTLADWNLEQIRADFPVLHQEVKGRPLVFLDNAASTQKPRQVINAISHYYEHDHSNVHRGLHELSNRATTAFEAARTRLATYLNAESADEIIWTRGTTEAINLVAYSWGRANLKRGDVVLLTEMEHHSNIVPWFILRDELGIEVRFLPVLPEGAGLDLEQLPSFLDERVKLFAFTHISNTLGVINPVAELCAKAREVGALTLVDGAQGAGHGPVDVREFGCDFYALSGHKMAGPTGIGALYGRTELLSKMPPWQGGGEMIAKVTFEGARWKPAPHRFEAGTPFIAGPIGLHAALDYLDALGRPEIAKHDRALAAYARRKLGELGFLRILGPAQGVERAGLVTFTMEGVHAHDVVELANERGVALRGGHHCNQPLMQKLQTPSSARASFYVYNTREEVDILAETLTFVRDYFAKA